MFSSKASVLEWLPVRRVSPRVLRIRKPVPYQDWAFEDSELNTYVIGTGRRRIMINTGDPKTFDYTFILEKAMIEYDFQLDHIILTHLHKGHLFGVKNVLDLINKKDECKVWKFPQTEYPQKKHKYKFPLRVLEYNQVFRIDGATLKIHHIRGYKPEKFVITLEEDNSLFTVACACMHETQTEFKYLQSGFPFVNLVLNQKITTLLPAHGPVIDNFLSTVNDCIEKEWAVRELLFDTIEKSSFQQLMEETLVDILYEDMKLKTKNTDGITLDPIFKVKNGVDLKSFASYIVHQSLLNLKKEYRLLNDGHIWRIPEFGEINYFPPRSTGEMILF